MDQSKKLELPNSYSRLNLDEMRMTAGGWCIEVKSWGYNIYFTNKETKQVANGETVIGIGLGLAGLEVPAAFVEGLGAIISTQNNGYGVRVRMTGLGAKAIPTGIFGLTKTEERNIANKNKVIFS